MSEEVELKLELSPAAADGLEAAGVFPGEGRVVRRHAIYFDTPDHRLARAGFSLRIRCDGDRRVQTVKASGEAAGLFVRSEWERSAEDAPVIDETTPIRAVLGIEAGDLVEIFTVENQRRLWAVDGVEAALDRCRIAAGDRETDFCELELEQKAGEAEALFVLARQIDAVVPLHLGVLSKAERGYRLLGAARRHAKADPIALTLEMTAAEAFQVIVHACLRQFRLNEPAILEHRDPSALHQARVAVRRLRSALSIYRPMLKDGGAEPRSDDLRWLAGELGKARDLDVLTERIGKGALHDRLTAARAQAYDHALAALCSPRARGLMIDIAEWAALGPWLSQPDQQDIRALPAREFAATALDRFRRKVKKDGRRLAKLDDEARHEVRKAAKKLRYAVEFFAGLYARKGERRRLKRFIAALETLQDDLGALNDLVSAPAVLERLGWADDPEARPLLADDRKARLLADAVEAHDDFAEAKRFWR